MLPDEAARLSPACNAVAEYADPDDPLDHAELVIVLGGDGTILRAGEIVRGTDVPLLGVNLGHVGFLAESERDDLAFTVDRIASQTYEVEERMTLDVLIEKDGEVLARNWAINEATVEKASRERMIEVVLEVDGRPVTEFGCDGVVLATPTGSTAYAFSSGGPVVWPEVEALLIVPLSAHALFARPLVVAPTSVPAVDRPHARRRSRLVRRPAQRRPAARRARRGPQVGDEGAAGQARTPAVHRSAGREVRPARVRLARRRAVIRELHLLDLGVIRTPRSSSATP